MTYIVCNLYAPNQNNADKITFYESVFDAVLEFEQIYDCNNVIIAGDFNLVLKSNECKNRAYGNSEKQVARAVKRMINTANLEDLWATNPRYTWRRPNSDSFSTIDRFLYNKDLLKVETINVNWSLSFYDHAALEVRLQPVGQVKHSQSRFSRLYPILAKHPLTMELVIAGFTEMIETMAHDWDPHMKLEFAKLAIRTVCEKVQADRKVRERD